MSTLQHLNTAPMAEFVTTLSGIFEHSPWVPERVIPLRPFFSARALLDAMCAVVGQATSDEQLTLIRSHPELAGRAAIRGELTSASEREQQGAGLTDCSPEEFARLQKLNAQYTAKFGFPFILAVRGHNRASILTTLEKRMSHPIELEHELALEQIDRIAALRLGDLLGEPLV